MEVGIDQSHGSAPLGTIGSVIGVICFILSQLEPSDIRAWIVGVLGGLASLMSIIINWNKFWNKIKKKDK